MCSFILQIDHIWLFMAYNILEVDIRHTEFVNNSTYSIDIFIF